MSETDYGRDYRYAGDTSERGGERGGERGLAHIAYGLFALGIFTGNLATIGGVIAAYMGRDERRTIAGSHFDYLIRTFWKALLWFLILLAVTGILWITIIGILPAILLWLVYGLWYIIRVARGWLRLVNGEPAPY